MGKGCQTFQPGGGGLSSLDYQFHGCHSEPSWPMTTKFLNFSFLSLRHVLTKLERIKLLGGDNTATLFSLKGIRKFERDETVEVRSPNGLKT